MKNRILLFIGMLLFSCSFAMGQEAATETSPSQKGTIQLFASPELSALTMKWTSEYKRLNPDVQIKVNQAAGQTIPDLVKTGGGLGLLADPASSVSVQSIWHVVTGRDVIVPVMNASNPLLVEIYRKGITPERLRSLTKNPEKQSWGMLAGLSAELPVHYYTLTDASIQSGVADFLNTTGINTTGIEIADAEEMLSRLRKDPNAFGFCKLIQLVDPVTQQLAEQIKLVPIDKNGNGKIDYMEDICENLQSFSRGVWIGKYPKALSGSILAVSSQKPENETERAFLKWILTDGQQYLSPNGFSELVYSEQQTQLEQISQPATLAVVPLNKSYAFLKVIVLILFAFILISFGIDWLLRRKRSSKMPVLIRPSDSSFFSEEHVVVPQGLFFDKTHTWAFMRKDGSVRIGLDDFMQHVTGPITRVDLKKEGEKIRKGEQLLTISQKGKQMNIYAPLSGTIKAKNKLLKTDSSLINTSPYTEGWIYLIEPTNWTREIQLLSVAEKYKTGLKDEFSRLKDFFASEFKANEPRYDFVVLQDGGALKNNILADLGPEVWEDFQTRFMDCVR